MTQAKPARPLLCLALGVAAALWSWLLPTGIDGLWPWAPLPTQSWLAPLMLALAAVTQPAVTYLLALGLAAWYQWRRLHTLAGTIMLAVTLTYSATTLLKHLVARDRPATDWLGWLHVDASYPSGHVAAATCLAAVLVAAAMATARSRRTIWVWRGVGTAVVCLVALNRLLLGLHHLSDVIGAALVASFIWALSGLITGHVNVARTVRPTPARQVAVIFNPVKVRDLDTLRRLVSKELRLRRWPAPIWLETSIEDPGPGLAREALAGNAELVLVAGGDGTVRTVCGALAGTDCTVALIPSGTGNLLARNLSIPLDLSLSIQLAFDGKPTAIDLMRIDVPDRETEFAAVMVGLGADAAVLGSADESLKKQIGPAAYVVAGLSHIKATPFSARISIDDLEPLEREASLIEIGNVGELQAGVALMPEASATDGVLDVLIASPKDTAQVAQLMAGVLAGTDPESLVDRAKGKRIRIEVPEPTPCQLDGDVVGEVTQFDCQVLAGAVKIVL